ncbi:MAG: hypothetical protein QOF78_358 [Phycisphaerales bacterium]|nr:hypothetical protein [Phycisphaerales bacterium]
MSDDAALGQIAPSVEIAPQGLPDQVDVTTAAAAAQPDHRGERARRLKWSIITSLITKPLAFVTPIITVPLFLHYLGKERYGLFESVGALAIWLTLTNGGLSLGLLNRLTDCHVSGDRVLARKYTSSLVLVLLAMTIVFTLIVSAIVPAVDWQRVFPVGDPVARRETPIAVWTAAMITLWGLLFAVAHPIYAAYQENHRNNLWDGAAKVFTLIACLLVVLTKWGVVGVILAAAGVPMLVRFINTMVLFGWEKRWLLPSPRYFDHRLLMGTVKQGVGLFIIASAAMGIFHVDKLIIGHMLGQDAVAEYSVVGRPFTIVFGLYSLLLSPLWPAFGEALRRGDVEWVRRTLRWSILAGFGAIVACGVGMFFFADRILSVWTRGAVADVSRSLVIAMTALFAMWIWMSSLSIVLNSAGVLRAQMKFMALHAVLNVLLAFALAKPFGVTGVAWSMSITGLLTSAWGYPWMVRKHILQRAWTTPAPAPPAAT